MRTGGEAVSLTAQQKSIASQLTRFLDGPERCFVLKGYAGTGKTFLIGHVARMLERRNREVWLLAPTGRAARVLSRKTGLESSTIHRAIYNLKELVEHEDANVAFKFHYRVKAVATDNLDVVVFVDEASMVSDQYVEGEFLRFGSGRVLLDLLTFLRLNDPTQKTKLVLVGDPAQLPPVTSSESSALDPAYLARAHGLEAKEAELTEVVRQTAGSAILTEATEIRRTLSSGCHNRLCIKPSPPQIVGIAAEELPARFIEANKDSRLPRAVCVAYSNATCLNLNVAIRAKRSGGDGMHAPAGGDLLLAIRNNATTGLLNGDLVSIIRADAECERVRVRVGPESVELVFRNLKILAESESGAMVELDTKIVENVLFSEKRDLSPLEQKALFVHFKIRHPDLKPNTRAFVEALRADRYFNAVQVKFGYALTCHKAQGGEWEDVFVVFENARIDSNALRWAYTALTRAKARVFGVNLPSRTPWAGVLPAAVPAGPGAGVRPVAAGAAANAAVVADSGRATDWDEVFPAEPGFLLAQHRRMTAAFDHAGIGIGNVEVRVRNYYWRYSLCKGGRLAKVHVSFNKSGGITPRALPSAGCDDALGREALACIGNVAVSGAGAVAEAIAFPSDKPYLRDFYAECMLPRVQAARAEVQRIEHLPYRERYFIVRGASRLVVDAVYKARGTITGLCRVSGDGEELGRAVLGGA